MVSELKARAWKWRERGGLSLGQVRPAPAGSMLIGYCFGLSGTKISVRSSSGAVMVGSL